MYRFWDGRNWSAALSPHPAAAPPQAPPGSLPPGPVPSVAPPRRARGWLLALAAVLIAAVVIVVLVVRSIVIAGPGPDPGPTGTPSVDVCPTPRDGTPQPQPNDGRVHAGKLSYPQLGAPWSPPSTETRVAFGKGVLIQSIDIEPMPSGAYWMAAVIVGELVAGDGFFTPEAGAAIVVTCVSGSFYGDSAVTRKDRRNEATRVDGHDAWIVESQLGFDIPGIQAKSERLIVVIVDTGAGTAGLFYASIPENAEQYLAPAEQALEDLTVDD